MTVEFIDTNILIYAEDSGMGAKHQIAVDLVAWLARRERMLVTLSIQVLAEYYNAATKKLHMTSEEAEATRPQTSHAGKSTGPHRP